MLARGPSTGMAQEKKSPIFSLGDPVPWFVAPTVDRPDFHFSIAGGRYVVLTFLGSARDPRFGAMAREMAACERVYNDVRASLFTVTCDRADLDEGRLEERTPGARLFLDYGRRLSRLYGAADGADGAYRPFSLVLDRSLRVLASIPIADPAAHAAQVLAVIDAQQPTGERSMAGPGAPVLTVPHVFEREFCRELIALYDKEGGEDSGFMRTDPATGKTISVLDHGFKRRADCAIHDRALQDVINGKIARRLVPEVRKVFQFSATRIERHIVACYDSQTGGYFRAHRDDTTKGTAHRRFAVTINLNAEEYEGGDLRFPEYDSRYYRAPTGGAVVFSCSLLHEVWPITRGRRFCFLPFLYDEAAAAQRVKNKESLAEEKLRDVVGRIPPPAVT
jgi:predicted 2-oxoglutarate/Fe(II)-dependent dioxygenase YbiX